MVGYWHIGLRTPGHVMVTASGPVAVLLGPTLFHSRDCDLSRVTRLLHIVGGPPRTGKSALGRRVMERRQVPWLSTDILRTVRTVLRTVDREIDELDRGHADPDLVADRMYPYLERTADVALDLSETFLIEGVEWAPRHRAALASGLENVSLRACFLGNVAYSHADLASHQGANRWHEGMIEEELQRLPEWIRRWSDRLRTDCAETGERYIDVGELGFDEAMLAAERSLFGDCARP